MRTTRCYRNEIRDPDLVFKTDRWSRYSWSRLIEEHDAAQALLERSRAKLHSFQRFTREVFARLFSDSEEQIEHVRPEDTWAVRLHEELQGLPDFDQLRRRCRGDRVLAGEAALAFAEHVLDKLPNPPPVQDPEELRGQVRGLLQLQDSLRDVKLDTVLSSAATPAAPLRTELEAVRERGQEAVSAWLRFAEGLEPTDVRRTLRAAARKGQQRADEIDQQVAAFAGWGSSSGSAGASGASVELKAQLAEALREDAKLQELARESGRLRRIAAEKQRSKVDHGADEITDVELGNDLGRLLPSELLGLVEPARWPDFARRYHERSLMQYKLEGSETLGRGPIVVLLDESSSMEGAKEIWSKAMCLALLDIATRQKRSCRVLRFNTGVVRVDDWRPGHVDPLALLESMRSFSGGGTAFEPPLESALDAIEKDAELKAADVVLVTDGEADISAEFLERWDRARKRLEFTTYAVHVDAVGGIAPSVLHTVADRVIGLASVRDDEAATEAVLSI